MTPLCFRLLRGSRRRAGVGSSVVRRDHELELALPPVAGGPAAGSPRASGQRARGSRAGRPAAGNSLRSTSPGVAPCRDSWGRCSRYHAMYAASSRFHGGPRERDEEQAEALGLQGAPEALEDGDRAVLSERTEARLDAIARAPVAVLALELHAACSTVGLLNGAGGGAGGAGGLRASLRLTVLAARCRPPRARTLAMRLRPKRGAARLS